MEQEIEKTVPARSAREFQVKEKMEERTEWRGQNESQIVGKEKNNDRFVGAAKTSKERAEWCRLQRKNLSILGLPKRKQWPQCHRESSWQERRSRPSQKEKEQSCQSRAPNREGERVKVSESRTLARVRGIRARAWSGNGGLHSEGKQIPRRKRRACKKSLPRRSRRKHERVSGRKTSPRKICRVLVSLQVWPNLK